MNAQIAWVEAVSQLAGHTPIAEQSAHDMSIRYAEPHRRYHRTSHVEAVLVDASRLAAAEGLDSRQKAILTLAVCAHDVVYDARPGDDETASAEWARRHLASAGIDQEIIEVVVALILTTLSHSFDSKDVLAAVLSDADLAILGADEVTYDGYAKAVRQEFAEVPEDLWAVGRHHVLEHLLAKPTLFATRLGRANWEARARENIRRELLALPTTSPTT